MGVEVSVCVLAYNHEGYIARCLDSILAQETSFEFEVLVRDDASTDGTVAVLRDYERRFGGKVRLILEERNTWNDPDTKPLFGRTMAPLAEGRYIATCEGDDYWTCVTKLQQQFDYMEAHPECAMCCHAVEVVRDGKRATQTLTCGADERDIPCEEVMLNWGRTTAEGIWSLHASSCFSRVGAELEYASSWRLGKGAGDYARICYYSQAAPLHYLPQVMSAYRYLAADSWSASGEQSVGELAGHYEEFIAVMERIDELTGYRYHEAAMRGCVQRALLLAGMPGGRGFFDSGVGAPIREYLTAKDRAILLALRALSLVHLRPQRDIATGRISLVRW